MPRTLFVIAILSIILIAACKVTEDDFVGMYHSKGFPKVTLAINPDNTFEKIIIYGNPFLYGNDSPEYYFYRTSGDWQLSDNRLILNSISDTLDSRPEVQKSINAGQPDVSQYVFFDVYGDTIPINQVKTPKGYLHSFAGRMSNCEYTASKNDSLDFEFFGSPHYISVSESDTGYIYTVKLKPHFLPEYFRNSEFKIKRKKIIDIEVGEVFIKPKLIN